jgi:hypothetical protein
MTTADKKNPKPRNDAGDSLTHAGLMFDTPIFNTEQAAKLLGFKDRFALDQRRSRGKGPMHHLVGNASKQPRIRYSLRDLIEYAATLQLRKRRT